MILSFKFFAYYNDSNLNHNYDYDYDCYIIINDSYDHYYDDDWHNSDSKSYH